MEGRRRGFLVLLIVLFLGIIATCCSEEKVKQEKAKEEPTILDVVRAIEITKKQNVKEEQDKVNNLAKAKKKRPPSFIIEEMKSNHSHIRSELLARGWVEKRRRGAFEPPVDFKWSWSYERVALNLQPGQYTNHFSNNDEVGTKIGLLVNLRKWKAKQMRSLKDGQSPFASVDSYFPRAYLLVKQSGAEPEILATPEQETKERECFLKDFVATQQRNLLVASVKNSELFPDANIIEATTTDTTVNDCESIDQKEIDGSRNVWIVKPSRSARGNGIRLFNSSEAIMHYIENDESTADTSFIVQKYVENPLLIGGKKFDIRLFVLVVSLKPLVLFVNTNFYLRFTSVDYSLDDIENRYIHLSNHQVQKDAPNFEEDATQWSQDAFKSYIDEHYGDDAWDRIIKSMHDLALSSLLSWPDRAKAHRDRSFELLGFDILLDTQLKAWLLEINTSPGLHLLTDVVRVHHPKFIADMFKVVLDNADCWKGTEGKAAAKCTPANNPYGDLRLLYSEA